MPMWALGPLRRIPETQAMKRHISLASAGAVEQHEVPRRPLIMRLPFFLLFGSNKATRKNAKGKRILLGDLVEHPICVRRYQTFTDDWDCSYPVSPTPGASNECASFVRNVVQVCVFLALPPQ